MISPLAKQPEIMWDNGKPVNINQLSQFNPLLNQIPMFNQNPKDNPLLTIARQIVQMALPNNIASKISGIPASKARQAEMIKLGQTEVPKIIPKEILTNLTDYIKANTNRNINNKSYNINELYNLIKEVEKPQGEKYIKYLNR